MHRLLVAAELLAEDRPELPKEALRHLRVLRLQPNEKVELFDGKGVVRTYSCASVADCSLVAVSDARRFVRSGPDLTLFACVTKGSRWDWTVEKATELGVSRIVPVISDRTIVRIPPEERAAKRERWMRIAEDAARQSDAKWLPEIVEAVDFRDSLALVRDTECFVGALTDPPSPPLVRSVAGAKGERLSCYVGPEGDFTPDELNALLKIAHPTSFGSSVLRAETAAIYAVSVIQACIQTS